ncbi:hypothetical protein [Acinetobacter populi]|uniref:Uncharacterized protein n=1 Tax=Acinetobacter populi TaxID=1582270 RepID=A0A1Z9YXS7_9GAMM|nr:hypothetical protein [Acinetobacter populi]OUY07008.1 hypothetical protein CAP51_09945 [Acinetobacter populi]
MSFKYQAPEGYKPTTIVVSGEQLPVKNGVIESGQDIYHILKPLGFERNVEIPDSKKVISAKS